MGKGQAAKPGSSVRFARMEHVRAHEYVAEQIRRQIMLRVISSGHALPPERQLAEMFGVGRKTVQEAIAVLVGEGLLEARRGRTGGTFVLGPVGADQPLQRLVGKIRSDRALIEEILTFRSEVEPAAAAQACYARTEHDIERIHAAVLRIREAPDDREFMRFDTEFHLAIGHATHNRFFSEAIERIRLVLNDPLVVLPDSDLWHARTYAEHEAIAAAISDRDTNTARRVAGAHADHTRQSIKALLAAL